MNDEGFEINIFVIDKHPVAFLSLLSKEVGWVFIYFLKARKIMLFLVRNDQEIACFAQRQCIVYHVF